MIEVWQTTNQEPWVTAFVEGAIKFKTRTSPIHVPIGAPILLHCSTKPWPDWGYFINDIMQHYAERMDELRCNFGHIIAVGVLSKKGTISDYSYEDLFPWSVVWGYCAAKYTWECENIHTLRIPVKTRGFQAPFCRAKLDTVAQVLEANPEIATLIK